jgi:hypothetical protein
MQVLGLQGTERKNLVPVDWVSTAIVRIFQQSALHARTYHLTHPHPVTADDLDAAIGEAIQASLAEQPGNGRTSKPLTREQMEEFGARMQVYAAYLRNDPEFDTRHLAEALPDWECPRMDHSLLVRLAKYAIKSHFGWPRVRPGPVDFDVGELLGKLPSGSARRGDALSLHLEVSGSGGGLWQIALDQGRSLVTALDGGADVSAYLNIHTLRDILGQGQTVERAVAAGRVVLEGTKDSISGVSGLLEALFARLREAE